MYELPEPDVEWPLWIPGEMIVSFEFDKDNEVKNNFYS